MTEETNKGGTEQTVERLEPARKPMTFAENVVLTIKLLLITGVILGALMAMIQFTK